jgi:hypothetical protein
MPKIDREKMPVERGSMIPSGYPICSDGDFGGPRSKGGLPHVEHDTSVWDR